MRVRRPLGEAATRGIASSWNSNRRARHGVVRKVSTKMGLTYTRGAAHPFGGLVQVWSRVDTPDTVASCADGAGGGVAAVTQGETVRTRLVGLA